MANKALDNISEEDAPKLSRRQRRALATGVELPFFLPETGFLRIKQILKFIPVSKATFWNGVRSGRFPKPIPKRPGERATFWRVEDIRALIADMGSKN
ncbi:MAG: prophage regulatory protein [Clostridiales bacterium]|nr:prophage regulatory protein [Clostridiales bacterium]MDN5281534.1 prophage regulatory protein [Candidatus Ozemobacter sp.]